MRAPVLFACCALAACGERREKSAEPAVEPAAPAAAAADPAAGVSPGKSDRLPAYIGVWATEASLCPLTPGGVEPGPIAFTASEFVGYENRCRIGETAESEGEFRLRLYCESQGVEYEEAVVADVDGDAMRLVRGDGMEFNYVRCGQ